MLDAPTLLRDARRRSGLSQRALAARAGTAASTVAKIELGRMSPTVALLDHLVRAAGCELAARLVWRPT
jgi:transcriptional regulator with XRE-family HTH domain